MSKEAMKLALEHAKRDERHANHAETRYWCRMYRDIAEKAVEALEKPDFWEGYVPEPDSTCSNALRIQGKAYPRTCKKCGLGPCVELAQQALDKKTENAKELGLDYEPAQQEPLQNNPFDCGVYLGSGKDYAIKHHVSYGPAQQEPFGFAVMENPIAPPVQPTWVGLTHEEVEEVWEQVESSDFLDCVHPFARAIEAKLKEKNT